MFAIDDCKDADSTTGNVGDSAKIETIIKEINQAKTMQELIAVYNKHIDYARDEQVISTFTKRKQALNGTK